MDELEFRRRLYSDPNSKDNELLNAIEADPSRKKFAKELKSLDDKIDSVLRVDVPEDLADRLILRQSLDSHSQRQRKSRWHLAVAASVAFIVGISVSYMAITPSHSSIADYSLAHYHHEAGNFAHSGDSKYTLTSFNKSVAGLDVSFTDKLGKLVSVDECFFDGMNSVHLVFEGLYDNVTVFIIPKNEHLAQSEQFADQSVKGISRQYSKGGVIIMGDVKEPLEQWQQKIDETIEWSI
ncbi:DUF3379 family protein [Thalassotalea sp. HSM 43]|uniref:DUF3379 family protein n=1 Tax=Thalassotalea sp. HSM 43 TaxID=2552945 RepID=UPI001679D374|nr:DUF3379 family protein [Thalassotalea sp. HSM 43]